MSKGFNRKLPVVTKQKAECRKPQRALIGSFLVLKNKSSFAGLHLFSGLRILCFRYCELRVLWIAHFRFFGLQYMDSLCSSNMSGVKNAEGLKRIWKVFVVATCGV